MTSLGFPMASSYVPGFPSVYSLFEILCSPNSLLRGHQDLLSNVPIGRLFERLSFVDNSFHVLILVVFGCHINPEHATSPSRHRRSNVRMWLRQRAQRDRLRSMGNQARTSHQLPAAAGDSPHPAVFSRLVVLDVLSSTTPRPSSRKLHWARHLAALATKPGEISGLGSSFTGFSALSFNSWWPRRWLVPACVCRDRGSGGWS